MIAGAEVDAEVEIEAEVVAKLLLENALGSVDREEMTEREWDRA